MIRYARSTAVKNVVCDGIQSWRVEVFQQIGTDSVGIAPAQQPVRFLDGTDRAAARSVP